MAKNQKKPTMLSMGGVMPRRPHKPQPGNSTVAASDIKPPKRTQPSRPNILNKISKPQIQKPLKNTRKSFLANGRAYLTLSLLPLLILALYLLKINSFPPVLNRAVNYDQLSDITSVEYLPFKAILVMLHKLHINFAFEARLLCSLIILFSLFCFYKILRIWLSRRMSVLGLLLYATSSWVLLHSRLIEPSIMLLAFIPVLFYLGKLLVESDSLIIKLLSSFVIIQLIFIPGGIWFLLLAIIGSLIYLRDQIASRTILVFSLTSILVLAGYAFLIVKLSLDSLSLLLKAAGFALGSLPTFNVVRTNISDLPGQLFYSGPHDSSIWLVGTPVIDWIAVIFLIAGLVCLVKSSIYKLGKIAIFSSLIVALGLIFINGSLFISLLLPLVYIVIAIGLAYLTDRWMIIFPNNPIARLFGFTLVCLVVTLVCAYHAERYFIGWPKTDGYQRIYKG